MLTQNLVVNKEFAFPKTTGFQSHLYGIESHQHEVVNKLVQGFNRTFMELKVRYPVSCTPPPRRFNRTFMELKVTMAMKYGLPTSVSIAPLWN